MDEDITLTSREAWDLALTLIEVLASIEDGARLRASWVAEARDWANLLLARREGGLE